MSMEARVRPTSVALSAVLALACGDVAYDGQQHTQAACENTSGGEQGSPDELSELLAELLAPRICDQVVGAYIGLPGDESHEGPDAGLDPSVGRWWIRQCQADVSEGRLRVAIAGSGWTWLDRESMGFRVRQYLRFDAAATFAASLHVGYDARTRIATVWLHPDPDVQATVTPQGLVRAEATGLFSSVLGGILDLTGSNANDRARTQAADEGSQRLRDRLTTGFTVTYQLDSQQMDFMLGELARGQTPARPWPNTEIPWVINERSAVWPMGMDVVGPIPIDTGEAALDLELEEGESAVVRRACADDLARWLDAAWNGSAEAVPPGESIAELRQVGVPQTLHIPAQDCRSVLLVTPGARASLPVMLRYRVTPLALPEEAPAEPTARVAYDGTGLGPAYRSPGLPGQPAPAPPVPVRIEVRSLSVTENTANGGDWDVVGGEPDPYLVVSSIPGRRELDRSPTSDDRREVRLDRMLPGALRVEDFPIRFVVYDEDVTSDELIGSADVEASALRAGALELVLSLRSQGDRPAQTGTLRVRLIPVQ
jgi:hypothetical protein